MARPSAKDFISDFFDYGVHLPSRTLYIGSESSDDGEESGTDFKMAEKAIKGLHLLQQAGSENGITIISNNIGGDVSHGFAIYNAIKSCSSHVTLKVAGNAQSMGSVVLQAADDRLAHQDSVIMIHPGGTSFSGSIKSVERWVKFTKKVDNRVDRIFMEKIKEKHPNFSLETFRNKTSDDWILTPEEALFYNLIDGIIEHGGTIRRAKT